MEADKGHHRRSRASHPIVRGGRALRLALGCGPAHSPPCASRVGFLIGLLVAVVMLGTSGATARNLGLGTGYTEPARAPLFSGVRAKLLGEGYRPAKLQHDYRDLCTNEDWSHICTRFAETLDCSGIAEWGECDLIFERPKAQVEAHGRYLLVSTSVTHRGRVVVHEQPADSEDLAKIAARKDLDRKGCGEQAILDIRVCDLSWPASSKTMTVAVPTFLSGRFWRDPAHGVPYTVARARLIHEGYRPAKLQHDQRDFCTDDAGSHVCSKYAETFDCKSSSSYDYCEFAFERPRAAWAARGPYLVVQAEVPDEGEMVVVHQETPGTDQIRQIWARKNLTRRGCGQEGLFETRICDPSWSPKEKRPKALDLPNLPPLPPSVR